MVLWYSDLQESILQRAPVILGLKDHNGPRSVVRKMDDSAISDPIRYGI